MIYGSEHYPDWSDESYESDESDVDFAFEGNYVDDSEILKIVREKVNWENEKERQQFFRRLYRSVKDKKDLEFYNFRDIFRPEEIDWLLIEDVKNNEDFDYENKGLLIKLVARNGYKDEPKVDEDGEPILRRATAVHQAVRQNFCKDDIVDSLFKIYNRFDVNYTDESGLTHFHAACKFRLDGVVAQFLVLGQDPDCIWTETGDSPLHLAMKYDHKETSKLLLKSGADPNLTNKDGLTPLHAICENGHPVDSAKMLFKISDEKHRTVQIDAVDKKGRTPLHLAAQKWLMEMVKWLVRKGANSNVADADGLTPLHVICKENWWNIDLVNIFFEINDEVNQLVQMDVMDKLGRTPLQWAVANLQLKTVDVLLNRGADLSTFVFPTEDYFAVAYNDPDYQYLPQFFLRLASNALATVEHLEKRGYKLDRTDALIIMYTFNKYRLFDCDYFDSHGLARDSFNREEFVSKAKNFMVIPTLSLYDLIQLQPEEAEKLLTYEDYSKLADSQEWYRIYDRHICSRRLRELMMRGFCRRWALESFMEVTRNKFPISWCENFINPLANEDLYFICLKAIEIRDELGDSD